MKKWFKDKYIYIINILVILCIFLLVLILNKISPFGNNMLGKGDTVIQYKPMLFDFITKLKSGTLLNYSFNSGLGNPFVFNYLYYFAGPLNLIAIFFKTSDAMYFSTIIIKLIIASIAMTYYTKSKTNNTFIIFIATISYVLSSWFLSYYTFTTWLDIFALFPIYQKGLEDLLDKKKYNTYIISLALLTISNFYLSFSIYIYTIVYFILYELIYKQNSKKEKLSKFNIISTMTMISFILIFAFIYILLDAYLKTGISFDSSINGYTVSIKDFIKSLFYSNTNYIVDPSGPTFPNIACNIFVLINVFYFFINKNIDKRTKIFSSIGILLIICVVFFKPFDFILNFFHNVRGLTFRYSFIIIFLSIKLLIYNLIHIEEQEYKKMLLSIPIILLLFLISFKNIEFNNRIITICSLLTYSIALFLYSNNKIHKYLIVFIIIIESFVSLEITTNSYIYSKEYIDYSLYNKENVKYRLNNMNLDIEDDHRRLQINENLYYNSKVTSFLTSMTYNNVVNLGINIGCYSYEFSYLECINENEYEKLLFNVKTDDYYLEKIYTANKEITLTDSGVDSTIKDNIENIIYSMTGINNLYDKTIIKGKIEDDKYIFETDEPYYLIETTNNDGSISTTPQEYHSFTQDIEYGHDTATIYTINKDKLKEVYNYLSKNQIKYTYYNDNRLEGTITVPENQIIFTSIPFDVSWEIKVDGKRVNPTIILDSLIGIDVEPGTHTISMKYKNTNYIGPAIVSILSIIIYITVNIKQKKKA